MKFIISNRNITLTLLFLFILCFFGGNISVAIINETPLVKWLTDNRINNVFTGADFSLLPAIAVLAVTYLLSVVFYSLLIVLLDLRDYLASPPANTQVFSSQSKTSAESPKTEAIHSDMTVKTKLSEHKDTQQ
ncbi:hypothetical protein ABWA34_004652 [Escherichia coli]